MTTRAQLRRIDAIYTALWSRAVGAANAAAILQNNTLGPERYRGLDCGFAWIILAGNKPFGRWAKKHDLAGPHYPRGLQIWYSKVHAVPTQSISVHEAAVQAAALVLREAGVECTWNSRLD